MTSPLLYPQGPSAGTRSGIEDKIKGLGFGADDYMTKSFHKDELIARVHAIVRRSKGHAHSVIQTGDLIVNLDTKTVEVNGARVHMTAKEYQMLELLALRKGTTLAKEMFLIARVHAIVRRSKGHAHSVIQTGDLVVNLDTKTVEVNRARVHMTAKEYQMLELLALRKGTTLTKESFLNHLYGGMNEPEMKIIDVFICKLRKKLANASGGKDYIETVWGRGYVIREPSENAASVPA